MAERFPETGLWPLRLHLLYDGSGRPWNGEQLEPVSESDVDAVDVPEALAERGGDGSCPSGTRGRPARDR